MGKKKNIEKSITRSQSEDSVSAYNEVVRVAELATIVLIGSEFRVSPEYYSDQENRTLHTALKKDEVVFDGDDLSLSQAVHFTLEAKIETEIELFAKATYLVAYRLHGEVEEDAAKSFVDRVAVMAAYPYFRARAAQYSWESSADLPPLPMIKSPPKKNKE